MFKKLKAKINPDDFFYEAYIEPLKSTPVMKEYVKFLRSEGACYTACEWSDTQPDPQAAWIKCDSCSWLRFLVTKTYSKWFAEDVLYEYVYQKTGVIRLAPIKKYFPTTPYYHSIFRKIWNIVKFYTLLKSLKAYRFFRKSK